MELHKIRRKVFAGGLWDEDTKLIRFGVRDYDPEVGRWTSKEPLGFKGSRNFYVYAENDGVNFVDLDGLRYTDYGGQDGHSGYGPNWWTFGENLRKDFPIIKKFLSQFLLGVFRRLGIFISLSLDMKMDSCPKKAPCEGRVTPKNIIDEAVEIKSRGKHREFRKWGGFIISYWDFKRLTGNFPIGNKDTANACDGTVINYHIGQKGNNFPTLWLMKGPKHYDHKIRYPIILLP